MIYLVFFSSRRRHTRCSRDWSSDVCSSDLGWAPPGPTTTAAPSTPAPPATTPPPARCRAPPRGTATCAASGRSSSKIGRASCRERVYNAMLPDPLQIHYHFLDNNVLISPYY